jgi:hypothetical protein
MTPLGAAISSRRMEAVRLLLDNGANAATLAMDDVAVVRNGPMALRNLTSLMLAAPYGSSEMIGALLKAGANVNAKDVRQMTPLMLAVASETQDLQVVELLLEAGAQVNEVSASGETALDWANKFGNISVIAALKKAGAKTGIVYNPPDKPNAQFRNAREALCASIGLLQRSSTEFFKQSGCVGCHHQPMAAMAARAARRTGLPVDEQAAKEQLRVMSSQAANSRCASYKERKQRPKSILGSRKACAKPNIRRTPSPIASSPASPRRNVQMEVGGGARRSRELPARKVILDQPFKPCECSRLIVSRPQKQRLTFESRTHAAGCSNRNHAPPTNPQCYC